MKPTTICSNPSILMWYGVLAYHALRLIDVKDVVKEIIQDNSRPHTPDASDFFIFFLAVLRFGTPSPLLAIEITTTFKKPRVMTTKI